MKHKRRRFTLEGIRSSIWRSKGWRRMTLFKKFSHDWLANLVVVKKKNRMCNEFMDLNKVCFKDSFHLLMIDILGDSIAGNEIMIFLNAFSNDRDRTSFMTERGTYCNNSFIECLKHKLEKP